MIPPRNNALRQPLRPARKRGVSRSRGMYEARGATRNFQTEVGSSTRYMAVPRCPALSSGEAKMDGFWPRIYMYGKKRACTRDIFFSWQPRDFWRFSATFLSALRAAIYSPVPLVRYTGSLTSTSDPLVLTNLRDLSWFSTGRWR
jgi:hypothetical protein